MLTNTNKNYLQRNSLEQLLARQELWPARNKDKEFIFGAGTNLLESSEKITVSNKRSAAPFLSEIDKYLGQGGLPFGEIHEWSFKHLEKANYAQKKNWQAPISIFLFLISNSLKSYLKDSGQDHHQRKIFFIGRRCWPTPHALSEYFGNNSSFLSKSSQEDALYNWQENCFFIDPPSKEQRLFSSVLALQSCSALAVISDISFSSLIDSRRMKLAAKKSGALGLLFRSPWEEQASKLSASAASTRWELEARPQGWKLKLDYAKSCNVPVEWLLEPEFGILSVTDKENEKPHSKPRSKAFDNNVLGLHKAYRL